MRLSFSYLASCVFGIAILGFSIIEEPEVTITIDGKKVDLEIGISKEAVKGDLNVSVTGEKYKYDVSEFEIILSEGDKAKRKATGKSGKISLKNFTDKAKKGDYLVIKITRLYGTNDEGISDRLSSKGMIYTIPIN